MIQSDDHVVESHGQRRRPEFVDPGSGDAFQGSAQIVAEQPGGPTLKRRQSLDPLGGESFQPPIQFAQAVAAVGRNSDEIEGIGGQKRISAQVGMDYRAVEEETMRQAGHPPKQLFGWQQLREFLDQRQ